MDELAEWMLFAVVVFQSNLEHTRRIWDEEESAAAPREQQDDESALKQTNRKASKIWQNK